MDGKSRTYFYFTQPLERRTVLKAALGTVLGLSRFPGLAAAQEADPKTVRPQEGDWLVFPYGERRGEVITPKDVPLGGPQVMAYPMDPRTKVVRDGSRLNQVLLIRLDPEEFTEETRAHSADGIVAYSAVCTHLCCDVSQWHLEAKILLCPCHGSQFDPRDRAKVIDGPAPRRLAVLPLRVVDNVLVAAGGFIGRVGCSLG